MPEKRDDVCYFGVDFSCMGDFDAGKGTPQHITVRQQVISTNGQVGKIACGSGKLILRTYSEDLC